MWSTISRENAIYLIGKIRNYVESNINLSDYFSSDVLEEREEGIELETDMRGVSNGFLSEVLCAVTGYEVEVCGDVEKMFPCPCCGLKTLSETYNPIEGTGYDICPYCKWEDDGTTDITAYRSINKGSIEDYRNNMKVNANKYFINKWLE